MLQLSLNISQDANIYFTNNMADCGGALYLASIKMIVGSRVNLKLHQNKVREYRNILNYFFGGAILAEMSNITIGERAQAYKLVAILLAMVEEFISGKIVLSLCTGILLSNW